MPSSDEQNRANRPIRILHVLGCMDRGGVETWLMQILRHIDRSRFQMDFLVHTARPGAYDEEIESLGSRVIPFGRDRGFEGFVAGRIQDRWWRWRSGVMWAGSSISGTAWSRCSRPGP